MPIKVTCKNGHKLNAPDDLAGRTVQCPKCKVPVQIQVAVVAEVIEVIEPVEALPFDAAQSDYPDPFADPVADPFSAAPLPTANSSAPVQNFGMPAQAIGTPAVAKKAVAKKGVVNKGAQATPQSDNMLWKMRFIFGGSGVLSGLLVGSLILFLMWPSGSSGGSSGGWSGVAPKLIESHALRQALLMQKKKMLQKEGSSAEPDESELDNEIAYAKELFPEFMMVTEATEALLQSGKPDPTTKTRQDSLLRGFKEVLNSDINGPSDTSTFSPADFEVLFRYLATEWRGRLLHLESTDLKQWQAIQKIEDEVFGPLSIFRKLKEPEDKRITESITLDTNLGRIVLATINFESTYRTFPSADGYPAIKTGGLSWRVAILPTLGYSELYNEFKLDEPWNSDHNKTLIAKMPKEFQTPGVTNVGFTAIHAVQGVHCVFNARQPRRTGDVTDGLKTTAMFIVGGTKTAQEWTNPDGFLLDASAGVEQLGDPAHRMFQTSDRDARTFPKDIVANELHQLAAISDGLPLKDQFDTKYPKANSPKDRFNRLLVNLRNIDPTKK